MQPNWTKTRTNPENTIYEASIRIVYGLASTRAKVPGRGERITLIAATDGHWAVVYGDGRQHVQGLAADLASAKRAALDAAPGFACQIRTSTYIPDYPETRPGCIGHVPVELHAAEGGCICEVVA